MEETPNFGGNTRPQSGMEPHEDVTPTVDLSYLNLDQYGTQRRRKDPTYFVDLDLLIPNVFIFLHKNALFSRFRAPKCE